jgi:hypothetical protein
VEFTDGRATWRPPGAVVYYGACDSSGPAVTVCCGYLRFFTDRANALSWAAQRPEAAGQVLDQAEAERLGAQILGPSLTDSP